MRIPYPTRINVNHVLMVAVLLMLAQILDGTNPVIAVLICVALVCATVAFNLLDGLATVGGAFIVFMAVPTFVILLFIKVFTWEPTGKHFTHPMLTIAATAGGWIGILIAAGVSRRFAVRRSLIHFNVRDLENLRNTAAGLFGLGVLVQVLLSNYGTSQNGSFWTALSQLNNFAPIATVLATYYEICISRGKRSLNWIVIVSILYTAGFGFIAASKEGMYYPFLAYFLVCAALQYKFRPLQVMGLLGWLVVAVGFMFPWAQYARGYTRQATFTETVRATYDLLRDPATIPAMYAWIAESSKRNEDINQVNLCYDHPHGLMDRESLICQDDALIALTKHTGSVGAGYLVTGFKMIVPHALWPSRPSVFLGNVYGRETGLTSTEDYTTEVAFAPVGDAYREFGWSGVVMVMPIMYFFTFIILEGIFGDARESPWGLVMVSYAAVMAPGLLLPVHPQLWGHTIPIVLFLAWLTRYVAPQIAIALGFRKIHAKVVMPGTELVPKASEPQISL